MHGKVWVWLLALPQDFLDNAGVVSVCHFQMHVTGIEYPPVVLPL